MSQPNLFGLRSQVKKLWVQLPQVLWPEKIFVTVVNEVTSDLGGLRIHMGHLYSVPVACKKKSVLALRDFSNRLLFAYYLQLLRRTAFP